MNVVQGKKIILVIASEGFQPIEYLITKKALEKVGVIVITASDKLGGAVATDRSTTPVDISIDQIRIQDYNGIFFIGGSGNSYLPRSFNKLSYSGSSKKISYSLRCYLHSNQDISKS